jgi:hypothetical protein
VINNANEGMTENFSLKNLYAKLPGFTFLSSLTCNALYLYPVSLVTKVTPISAFVILFNSGDETSIVSLLEKLIFGPQEIVINEIKSKIFFMIFIGLCALFSHFYF